MLEFFTQVIDSGFCVDENLAAFVEFVVRLVAATLFVLQVSLEFFEQTLAAKRRKRPQFTRHFNNLIPIYYMYIAIYVSKSDLCREYNEP